MTQLPVPAPGRPEAERFVQTHLAPFVRDEVNGSTSITGGQQAADAALAAFDVAGYAARRNEVWPTGRRGASRLSPYIRHGLLSLPSVWSHVAGGPRRDVEKFRDELLWQEYARHWYARLGASTRHNLRNALPESDGHPRASIESGWPRTMRCLDVVLDELESDGWLVNQTRMWLAGHWTTRERTRWQDGEEQFFVHLLDGSRAANRLGWQWTTGAGSSKPYGFSRWQVERRAPGLCSTCELRTACPIEEWPEQPVLDRLSSPTELRRDPDPDRTAGPGEPWRRGTPDAVWLTAESLGADDPALSAHPTLPAVFVFDAPLLGRLQLSSKRLVFITETLAELAVDRPVELHLGDPVVELAGRSLAVTFAPVPGFTRRADPLEPVEIHPWPWLRRPGAGPITSFTAWRRATGG